MKKILTTITITVLMLCGAAHAQTTSGAFIFNTTSIPDFNIYNQDGETPISSYDGFIVTFWMTLDNDPDNLKMFGAAVTADYAYGENGWDSFFPPGFGEGGIDYMANESISINTSGSTLFAVRIFRVDQALITSNFSLYDGSNASPSYLGMDYSELEELWDSTTNNYLDIQYSGAVQLGTTPSLENTTFADVWAEKHGGQFVLIPEPSTWLMLGAGLAFIVVMRTRRKS